MCLTHIAVSEKLEIADNILAKRSNIIFSVTIKFFHQKNFLIRNCDE